MSDPINLRPYIASRLGRKEMGRSLRPIYGDLLQPVGLRDVVLSDELTMWLVPSFAGHIVHAYSYTEVLVGIGEDQQRRNDTRRFFTAETPEAERAAILDRWLILNRDHLATEVHEKLLEPKAVVEEVERLQLLDARHWKALRSGDGRPDRGTRPAAEAAAASSPTAP